MKPAIQLEIPKPCHENWNNMHPTEQGRFCLSCQKEVIDFSLMTDKEILNYLSKSKSQHCGRFENEQLNRMITDYPAPRKAWWKYWMSVAASIIMLSSKSNAQTRVKGEPVVCEDSIAPRQIVVGKLQAVQEPEANSFLISGTVSDEHNMPIPGASVQVKNSKLGTSTNLNGVFKMKTNALQIQTLVISAIGYDMQELTIRNNANSIVNVNLKMHASVLGGIVVVKKKRNLFKNLFKADSTKCVKNEAGPVLKVYPNPVVAGGDINLQFKNSIAGNYLLSVSDMDGNVVLTREINFTSKNAANVLHCDQKFKTGMYVLQIKRNGKAESANFLIQ